MNNSTPFLGKAPLTESQQACLDLLKELTEFAEEGRLNTVGIVACLDTGMATVMAGKQAADLNLGCDDLKRKIHAALFDDGNVAKAPKSRIVRAI